jgi:cytochrome c553
MIRTLLLASLLAACTKSSAEAPKPREAPPPIGPKASAPPPIRFEHDMMVRFHMHQNFDLMRAIERLLIRGQLDEARRFAEAISTAPDEPTHGPWASHVVIVRDRAAAVARATELNDAIRKTARLGAACGNCHGELGVLPELSKPPPVPPDHPTMDARMLRHRWAADRLWEGVVGNNDDAWRAGLDVLAAAPLVPPDQPDDRARLARQLQRVADQARQPSPGRLTDRATTYGEMLVLCASCHTQPRR